VFVRGAPPPRGAHEALRFSEDQLPAGVANEPYVVSIFISGNRTPVGGASVSSGELPDGLAVDVATGAQGALSAVQIHGTPTTPGSYTFTISVWCYGTNVSGQTGDKQYTLVVS
jgi:hypothetical protein